MDLLFNCSTSFYNQLGEKKQNLLFDLVNAVKANQNVINEKVDNMVMTQGYFMRAAVCRRVGSASTDRIDG